MRLEISHLSDVFATVGCALNQRSRFA